MPAPRAGAAAPRIVTLDLVREALSFIPPDMGHDERVRIAFAVFDGIGDAGADAWLDWAATRSNPDALEDRSTWLSAKKPGKVKIGTLFGVAKDNGFRFPAAADDAARATPNAAALEMARLQRQRKAESDETRYRELADRAAVVARELWELAAVDGESGYLKRKGVSGHGVRHLPNGTLLVPMRDAQGELQNVQRVLPRKPKNGIDKLYQLNGRKSGLWHLIGDQAGAAALLIAEGYATAATLHEATGLPVAVAFDAGNLVHVAKALRQLSPELLLLVCGDDDRSTHVRTGKNPGREKAIAAARAVATELGAAGVVFPVPLADGGSDFNDLAEASGLPAVEALVASAIRAPSIPKAQRRRNPGSGDTIDQANGVAQGRRGKKAPNASDVDDVDEPDPSEPDLFGFSVDGSGVWHQARDAEGSLKKRQWICTPLTVTARTRADDTNGWGYLLEFADPDHNAKTWAMPSAMLSGDSSEWAGRLRDMGLRIAPGAQPRNLLAKYVDTREPNARAICTDRVGWHGPVFVLPSGSIGTAEGRRYVFQSETGMDDTFRQRGTLDEWKREVAGPCIGNSRLAFPICCAFGAGMLRLASMEGGGFHLRGNSSIGKTTGLKVAASVWGRPTYMQRWRTTDNALEATAVQHCDSLLILDEIGQIDGRVLGECAYMLANGQEKGRATRGGLARRKRTWLTLFLSAGEISMADHMAEAGKRVRAGQEIRMVDVPLDTGNGMGGIEDCHDQAGPAQLADAIVSAAARFYGTAGRAWLEHVCENFDALTPRLHELIDQYRIEIVPEASSAQVRRVGSRFALVAAAGELASEAGITGWPQGEALRSVRACFNAWLASRGHLDNGEDASMLRQVKQFIEAHGGGRFTWWHRALNDHAPNTLHRAGFRRMITPEGKPIKSDSDHVAEYGEHMSAVQGEQVVVEHFVLREIFASEVCKGFDPDAVAKLLQSRGHLKHDKGRLQLKVHLPGMGKVWCYALKPCIFEDEL